ncbi:asparagine synthase-related protein [Sphingomonas sp. LY29]|uniref:asparagine synthase-related protein n=1 Tax=Sphingomonas sp. LY29 TaxID=3095341 RepID=UPI002D79793E|nr:asparagine synthase-related protein [Sphingomonas sp. LY29]WRP26361.1 asparagine synthase-related protein [Sphingomonas sp. LY29]
MAAGAGIVSNSTPSDAPECAIAGAGPFALKFAEDEYFAIACEGVARRFGGEKELGSPALLRAFRDQSETFLRDLSGAFAIAVWDKSRRRLLLMRDALGFKPLFYVLQNGGIAFSSRADAFGALDPAVGRPDLETIITDLRFGPISERSFYTHVCQVRPGEIVTFDGRTAERRQWWQPDLGPESGEPQELLAEYNARLKASVARAVADPGPVLASHLSAGLDSGVVTALAADLRPVGSRLLALTGVPQMAMLPTMEHRLSDEGKIASLTAAALRNVEHVRVEARGSPFEPLKHAAARYQQPLPNPFNYGLFSRIQDVASAAGASKLLIAQFGNFSFSMAGDNLSPMRKLLSQAKSWLRPCGPVVSPDIFLREVAPVADDPGTNLSGAERRLEVLRSMNPGALLRGIEERWQLALQDPFADRHLVEFSLRLPESLLNASGIRGIATPIARDHLPRSHWSERRRGYQSADWIPRMRTFRAEASAMIAEFHDHAELSSLLDLPALDAAATRLATLERPTPQDERLYRIEFPRTLALAAFVIQAKAG